MLRRLNERFEMAQRAARVGVWDWDVTTGKIEWSEEMYHIFGLDQASNEANFDTWNSVVHPDDVEIANERIQRSLRDHTFLDNEYRVVRGDGEVVWVNALGQGEYDDQGQPLRMIGICVDITGRKTVEEALKESNDVPFDVSPPATKAWLFTNITRPGWRCALPHRGRQSAFERATAYPGRHQALPVAVVRASTLSGNVCSVEDR